MKRNSLDIISDDAYLLRCLYQIMHFYYMRMINLLKRHYLSLHSFSFHWIIQFRFLVDFDCVLSHVDFMIANVHDSVRSLADGLSYLIVFHDASRDGWGGLQIFSALRLTLVVTLTARFYLISIYTLGQNARFNARTWVVIVASSHVSVKLLVRYAWHLRFRFVNFCSWGLVILSTWFNFSWITCRISFVHCFSCSSGSFGCFSTNS